jgi:hypothetical protein
MYSKKKKSYLENRNLMSVETRFGGCRRALSDRIGGIVSHCKGIRSGFILVLLAYLILYN